MSSNPRNRRPLRALAVSALALCVLVTTGGSEAPRAFGVTEYVAAEPQRLSSGETLPRDGSTSVPVPGAPAGVRAAVLGVVADAADGETSLAICGAPATGSGCDRPGRGTVTQVAASGRVASWALVELDASGDHAVIVQNRGSEVTLHVDLLGFVVGASAAGTGNRIRGNRWLEGRRLATAPDVVPLPAVPAGSSAAVLRIGARDATGTTRVAACRPGGPCPSTISVGSGRDGSGVALVPVDPDGELVLRNETGEVTVDVDVIAYLVPGEVTTTAGYVVPVRPTPLFVGADRDAEHERELRDTAPPGASGVLLRLHGVDGGSETIVLPYGADGRASALGGEARSTARAVLLEGWTVGVPVLRGGAVSGSLEKVVGAVGGVEVTGWAADPDTADPIRVRLDVGGVNTSVLADQPRPDVAAAHPHLGRNFGFRAFVAGPPGRQEVCAVGENVGLGEDRHLGCHEVRVLSAARVATGAQGIDLDGATTGVPEGTVLSPHQGDLVITEPGTVVDAVDVAGFVVVQADDVLIRNSRIRGGPASAPTALVSNELGSRNLRVVDTEIAPDDPSPHLYGVKGWDFTLERVNIHRVIDSVHVYGPRVVVRSSWLHDNVHYRRDPNFGGRPSHDDGIQIQGGHDIQVIGSRIEGPRNSAVQITQDVARTRDVQLIGNYIDGGGCAVNVAEKGRGPVRGLMVSGNRFGRGMRLPGCAIIAPPSTELIAWNNQFADGEDVTVRTGR